MQAFFRDRREAGRRLAPRLERYCGRDDVLVLALPRGGVPVAYEVARRLRLPLDVFVVRKLGVPEQEELAMGAIASGGVIVVNHDVVRTLRISQAEIDFVEARERIELERREQEFRGGRPPLSVSGRTVVLVDDGVATGSTMYAAIAALRINAARIVVAVPVAPPSTFANLETQVDEVVCLLTPSDFEAVGKYYENFTQTSDGEVRHLLQMRNRGAGPDVTQVLQ